MKQQRILPGPTIQAPVAPRPIAPSPAPMVAARAPAVTVTAQQAIELVNPTIELTHHIFIGDKQAIRLKPARALIVNGAIIVEEFNLILPLAGNYVRTS